MESIDRYTSDKLHILSFVFIVMIVYVHADFKDIPGEIHDMPVNLFLQKWIGGFFYAVRVPFFFMKSGFFFFYSVKGLQSIWLKMRKRIRTLLVPYIIAALLFVGLMYVLMSIPFVSEKMNSSTLFNTNNTGVLSWLCAVFYDAGNTVPLGFHLWFLRDLIMLTLLAPIFFYLRKWYYGIPLIASLFILSFITSISLVTSAFWFMFGTIAMQWLMRLRCQKAFLLLGVYVVFRLFMTAVEWNGWKTLNIPISLMGIAVVWVVYDHICKKTFKLSNSKWWTICVNYSFFIYLFHEPLLNIVRKGMLIPMGKSSLTFACSYLISPLITVALLIFIGSIMQRFCPRILALVTGKRSK